MTYTQIPPFRTAEPLFFWLLFSFAQAHVQAQVRPNPSRQSGQLVWQLPDAEVRRSFSRIMAVDPSLAFTIPCLPPVGFWEGNRISSGYGWRKHPISGRQAHHTGIDIAGTYQYIRAAATGIVKQAGYARGLGHYVRIDHGNSYQTTYGHLAQVLVSSGQRVQIGDKIGVLGQSGAATGLHLHYAITKNGRSIDPAPYLTLAIQLVDWYQRQTKPVANVPTK